MKTMQNLVCKALLAAVLLFPMQLLAHTGLKTSNPADGSTLQAAPASIELVYTADVRLIRVEITSNGEKVATGFQPSTETAASYTVATPGLGDGSYTVNWAVIGGDGHTVSDSFSFSISSSVAAVQ